MGMLVIGGDFCQNFKYGGKGSTSTLVRLRSFFGAVVI